MPTNNLLLKWIAASLLALSGNAFAQNYEHQQGAIFDQPYVQRISVDKAEKMAKAPNSLQPLLEFEWMEDKEVIKDPRVQRKGSRLLIQFPGNKQLSLKNFSTNKRDGYHQNFKFLKAIPGFHVVAVEYSNDQPQFLLVPENGGKLFFVETP